MPKYAKRKTYRKKKPYGTTYRRKSAIPRGLALYKKNNIHSYIRSFGSGPIQTSSISGEYLAGYFWTLNTLPSSGEFTALYESYRIDMIEWRIMCRTNSATLDTMTTNDDTGLPTLYYVIDRTDSSNPTSIDQLRQYSRCKVRNFGYKNKNVFTIRWKPNVLRQIYAGVTSGYEPSFPKWLDCTYDNIPHYGMKIGIQAYGAGASRTTYVFDIEQIYHLTFKDAH